MWWLLSCLGCQVVAILSCLAFSVAATLLSSVWCVGYFAALFLVWWLFLPGFWCVATFLPGFLWWLLCCLAFQWWLLSCQVFGIVKNKAPGIPKATAPDQTSVSHLSPCFRAAYPRPRPRHPTRRTPNSLELGSTCAAIKSTIHSTRRSVVCSKLQTLVRYSSAPAAPGGRQDNSSEGDSEKGEDRGTVLLAFLLPVVMPLLLVAMHLLLVSLFCSLLLVDIGCLFRSCSSLML